MEIGLGDNQYRKAETRLVQVVRDAARHGRHGLRVSCVEIVSLAWACSRTSR